MPSKPPTTELHCQSLLITLHKRFLIQFQNRVKKIRKIVVWDFQSHSITSKVFCSYCLPSQFPMRPQEGTRSPRVGVTGRCEVPDVDTRNQTLVLQNSTKCSYPPSHLSSPTLSIKKKKKKHRKFFKNSFIFIYGYVCACLSIFNVEFIFNYFNCMYLQNIA